ncbi:hypothetical protein CALCODRAFT_221358 [Calocera cornea HHB12733]|uniref:Uncharacterized protein n=1 Tax=Calocera cornea HHB12733 TaxID=1353952 RepID=A0A165C1G7_9BASI|nr:hypothetical protein CALCODRAFT_221358 [Calocera cornea HHB12733]
MEGAGDGEVTATPRKDATTVTFSARFSTMNSATQTSVELRGKSLEIFLDPALEYLPGGLSTLRGMVWKIGARHQRSAALADVVLTEPLSKTAAELVGACKPGAVMLDVQWLPDCVQKKHVSLEAEHWGGHRIAASHSETGSWALSTAAYKYRTYTRNSSTEGQSLHTLSERPHVDVTMVAGRADPGGTCKTRTDAVPVLDRLESILSIRLRAGQKVSMSGLCGVIADEVGRLLVPILPGRTKILTQHYCSFRRRHRGDGPCG